VPELFVQETIELYCTYNPNRLELDRVRPRLLGVQRAITDTPLPCDPDRPSEPQDSSGHQGNEYTAHGVSCGGSGVVAKSRVTKPSVAQSTSDRQTDQRSGDNNERLREFPFQRGEPERSDRNENGGDINQRLTGQNDHGPRDRPCCSCGDSG